MEQLGFATAWKASMLPATLMAHLVLHLGLQRLAIATLISEVDVEAALSAKAFGICDDHAVGAAAMAPRSVHQAVIVAHVPTIDALHAHGITMSGDNHVGMWQSHDAVGAVLATSGQVTIGYLGDNMNPKGVYGSFTLMEIVARKEEDPNFRVHLVLKVLRDDSWSQGCRLPPQDRSSHHLQGLPQSRATWLWCWFYCQQLRTTNLTRNTHTQKKKKKQQKRTSETDPRLL